MTVHRKWCILISETRKNTTHGGKENGRIKKHL
nr:MAG TPA: hypothetical protein [Bacteriophage sp.]